MRSRQRGVTVGMERSVQDGVSPGAAFTGMQPWVKRAGGVGRLSAPEPSGGQLGSSWAREPLARPRDVTVGCATARRRWFACVRVWRARGVSRSGGWTTVKRVGKARHP